MSHCRECKHKQNHDWPQYTRNPEGFRSVPEVLPFQQPKVNEVWSLKGIGVLGTPVSVVNERAYLGTSDSTLIPRFLSLDARTGRVIWEFRPSIATTTVSQPVVIEAFRRVYFTTCPFLGTPGDLASVYCLDLYTGQLIWKQEVALTPFDLILGSPTFGDRLLFVGMDSAENLIKSPPYIFHGNIVALDPITGTIRWRTLTSPEGFAPGSGITASPAVDPANHLVFIGTGQNYDNSAPLSPYADSLLALNTQTGKLIWSKQFTPGDVYSIAVPGQDLDVLTTPVVAGPYVVVADKKGHVYILKKCCGNLVKNLDLVPVFPSVGGLKGFNSTGAYQDGVYYIAGNVPKPPSPAIGPEFLGATTALTNIFAINVATGKVLWTIQGLEGAAVAAMSATRNFVFYGTTAGVFVIINAKTGAIVYQTRLLNSDLTQNIITVAPTVAGKYLYFTAGFNTPPTTITHYAWKLVEGLECP